VTALVRYTAASVLHSQRWLPPALLFLAALAVFIGNDPGSLVPVYAVTSAAVFVCGTWWTVAVVDAEDPGQRAITSVNAGGGGRVLVASVWVALAGCGVLSVVGLLFPLPGGGHPLSAAVFVLGVLAELTGGCTGVALGLVCSRLVFRRAGHTVLAAVSGVLLFVLVPWLPPIHPMFLLLASGTAPGGLLWAVAGYLAVSLVLLCLATMLAHAVSSRHD
jgi:hypothetical protein